MGAPAPPAEAWSGVLRRDPGRLCCYPALSPGLALCGCSDADLHVRGGRWTARGTDIPDDKDQVVANIKSQIKRNRQTVKRQARNKAVRSELRTRTKRAIRAIEDGEENSEEALRLAIKRIDKAAAKGVIHKNQAANRKPRLMKRTAAYLTEDEDFTEDEG